MRELDLSETLLINGNKMGHNFSYLVENVIYMGALGGLINMLVKTVTYAAFSHGFLLGAGVGLGASLVNRCIFD